MNYKKVNNITGWVVCLFACMVYILTMEATGSFWDCGEFVSSAYKLQIPHPPGAPLFVMMGRFFIILFGDNPNTAARAVNFMSAILSGLTILFLFWSVTHFARKIIQPKVSPSAHSRFSPSWQPEPLGLCVILSATPSGIVRLKVKYMDLLPSLPLLFFGRF